jgi:hypothetical protein
MADEQTSDDPERAGGRGVSEGVLSDSGADVVAVAVTRVVGLACVSRVARLRVVKRTP